MAYGRTFGCMAKSHSDGRLTVSEVATELGVSVRTVQRYVERGHLKAIKLPSGHSRIDSTEVDRVLNGGVPA